VPLASSQQTGRIGVLGGSFNPPHAGHREISLLALERLALDAVWWLVTPANPLKEAGVYAPYEDRIRAAQRLADHRDIVVSDFELRHSLQYTVETIEQLQRLNPDKNFVWLMGADSLSTFHRWKRWRCIAALVPIAVFNRPGHETAHLTSEAATTPGAMRRFDGSAEALADIDPPAWMFFPDVNNPLTSTAIRKSRSQPGVPSLPPPPSLPMTDLTAPYGPLAYFLDLHPDTGDFLTEALEGLSAAQKCISPKWFYDQHGSKLFDKITQLEEYYPTRTEKGLFLGKADEIIAAIGPRAAIFEYGSGSSEKIEWLVNGLKDPVAYIAMDISRNHLLESASELSSILKAPVAAICADFHTPVTLPQNILPDPDHMLGYFPGSTIGNMAPKTAQGFLIRASETLGGNAQFLIGVDLEKDKAILEAAYNDKDGVTAKFNLNLLERMQRELDADIDIGAFEHVAFYNETDRRIEMHLRALRPTAITLGGRSFGFIEGETLHTENSYKYSIDRLCALIEPTPWRMVNSWTDAKGWYAACLLSNS